MSDATEHDEPVAAWLVIGVWSFYLVTRLAAWSRCRLFEDHDSLGYLRDARAWSSIALDRLTPDSTPLYPISVALLDWPWWSIEFAARLSSFLFSIVLGAAVYRLAASIGGGTAAVAALMFLALDPMQIGLSFAMLSEPSFLAVVFAGYALWRSEREPTTSRRALGLGVVFACAFLSRTEGLIYLGVIPLLDLGRALLGSRPRAWLRARATRIALYVAAFLVVIAPQVLQVSRALGAPAINGRQVWVAMMNADDGWSVDRKVYGLDHDPAMINLDYLQSHPHAVASLVRGEGGSEQLAIVRHNVRELIARQIWRLVPLPVLLAALIGAVELLRRRAWLDLLWGAAAIGAGLIGPLLYNVALRHLAILTPAIAVFAGCGVALVGRRRRRAAWIIIAVVAVTAVIWDLPDYRRLADPPAFNREYDPARLAEPASIVREQGRRSAAPVRVCARKEYLPALAGGVRVPLPHADLAALQRYIALNDVEFLFVDRFLARRFPFSAELSADDAPPWLTLVHRDVSPEGRAIELWRVEREATPPS